MTRSREELWSREIRDALLGRFRSKTRVADALLSKERAELTEAPIRQWWTFEGKRYAPLRGPLAERWSELGHQGRRLLQTFNPRRRLTARPDVSVDWPRTFARAGLLTQPPSYTCLSSGVGLTPEEHRALTGWSWWLMREWEQWNRAVMRSDTSGRLAAVHEAEHALSGWGDRPPQGFTARDLGRWAATARRSRWPLLRELVAESLRFQLEPDQWIDQLPLPSQDEVLFELLCLVRLIRAMVGTPRVLRWLDVDLTDNCVVADGLRIWYQRSIPEAEMLATPLFSDGLAEAMRHWSLRKPRRIDLLVELEAEQTGFDAMLIEVKSGEQKADSALWQLKAYRAALAARGAHRCVVWIIAESQRPLAEEDLSWIEASVTEGGDVWLVSNHDDVGRAVGALGLSHASTP